MALYVPIMGRSGAGTNAEVIVGLLIGTKFGFLFTCIVSIDTFVPKEAFLTLLRDKVQVEVRLDNVLSGLSHISGTDGYEVLIE